METLDRGSDLVQQIKDLRLNSGSQFSLDQTSVSSNSSAKPNLFNRRNQQRNQFYRGWNVHDSRTGLENNQQRISTPPAISTQESEWDPSYGFLSPQLRTRNNFPQRCLNTSVASVDSPVTSSRLCQPSRSSLSRNPPVSSRNGNRGGFGPTRNQGGEGRKAVYPTDNQCRDNRYMKKFPSNADRQQRKGSTTPDPSRRHLPRQNDLGAQNRLEGLCEEGGQEPMDDMNTQEIVEENTYQTLKNMKSVSPGTKSRIPVFNSPYRRPVSEQSYKSNYAKPRVVGVPGGSTVAGPTIYGSTLTNGDHVTVVPAVNGGGGGGVTVRGTYLACSTAAQNAAVPSSGGVYRSPDKMSGYTTSSSSYTTPHKYEQVSNSSDYQTFGSPAVNRRRKVSESYEPIEHAGNQEKVYLHNSQKVQSAADASNKRIKDYIDSRNTKIYMPQTRNSSLERDLVLMRSPKKRDKLIHQMNRRSCDMNLQENIYSEPSRYGLGKRSVTQLEMVRSKVPTTSSSGCAEYGKLDNHGPTTTRRLDPLGTRIPRVAESRIPRLQEKSNPPPMHYQVSQPCAGQTLLNPGPSFDQLSPDIGLNLTLKKGILWSQRKRLFSRWKEKYFILTPDYLQCFKKSDSRISEMGAFDYKVRLTDIENMFLEDRKGYYTINIGLKGEDTILLRRTEAIKDWYIAIYEAANTSRERRKEMLSTREFWSLRQITDTTAMQSYVHNVQKGGQSSAVLRRRGISPHHYSPCSTPSPSPRFTSPSPQVMSPSPLTSCQGRLPNYLNNNPHLKNNSPMMSPLLGGQGEMDSGIDSLLTSLSDTSSNYSHRRILSPR